MLDTIQKADPLTEARAALATAQRRRDNLSRRQRAAERARDAARDEREALLAWLARGEDVPSATVAEAGAAIEKAAADVAMLEEAMPKAEAAIKAAERHLVRALQDELARRVPVFIKKVEEARSRRDAAEAEKNQHAASIEDCKYAASPLRSRDATVEGLESVLARNPISD